MTELDRAPSLRSHEERAPPPPSGALDGDLRRCDRRCRACSVSSARWSPRTLFGVAGKINAFTVAFQIPNLVRALVADAALSGAFVPVFSELLEKGERARAWRVASTIFWLVLLFSSGLTALFMLAAPSIVALFGDPGGDFDLAVGLSRVLFPIVVLLGLSGIVVGILNAYDQFTVPALTPVAWNLVIILGLVLGVPRRTARTPSCTSTPARWSSRRWSSSCCRCRGCAASTAGCDSRSTGAIRR